MQNFVKVAMAFVLAFAVILVSLPSTTKAQNAGVISSILNKMERNYRDLKSLRADISMEQYDPVIKKSDWKKGWVLYLPEKGRSASFRVEWTEGARETLSVADGQFSLCNHRRKECFQGNAKKQTSTPKGSSSVISFLTMSGAQIKASFEFKDVYEDKGATHFTLVPKTKTDYQYAEVWVDGYGMPIQSKVVGFNGDATTIRLSNVERNKDGIRKDHIVFNPPDYTKKKA